MAARHSQMAFVNADERQCPPLSLTLPTTHCESVHSKKYNRSLFLESSSLKSYDWIPDYFYDVTELETFFNYTARRHAIRNTEIYYMPSRAVHHIWLHLMPAAGGRPCLLSFGAIPQSNITDFSPRLRRYATAPPPTPVGDYSIRCLGGRCTGNFSQPTGGNVYKGDGWGLGDAQFTFIPLSSILAETH